MSLRCSLGFRAIRLCCLGPFRMSKGFPHAPAAPAGSAARSGDVAEGDGRDIGAPGEKRCDLRKAKLRGI